MCSIYGFYCQQRNEGEEEAVDVEGDVEGEQYEEYTWAGQTRIRATTLLEGGFAGIFSFMSWISFYFCCF